ncbi:rod shape-determining protein MreC [Companilactobacillus paralimentarius DSM 13238 = JCM 10415]|jgi:rod shape-determining protein MreC|uniref:Cell shape-determining protein MreC n=1 Tax=Companilactobacillus paralimentarius DSM 13238 = JCM 10415 TaxID=1122151 RepID=A0A0R1PIS8_9LACO|nr:rod shape-determining protein MreC [Companilactobacillus paralimentarius]KAE9564992.1 rod shape-determining protein MreC [Companilactobacillus paralimentarius]KRL32359.1 rod shape-determining protein MreC [Companilactobacillus paralimentarius DSM 13238 = JCM 10415]MDR4933729.1 rod shape-determining protein MreC [Companilactobacillus paralimentarius]QFR70176.1 rod shape-determining protein MreC [Companilactobacillus paralimentarius]
MQKFFSNKKLIILMILIIVTFGLLAVTVNIRDKKSTPPVVQQVGNDVVSVVGGVFAYPTNAVKNATSEFSDLYNTYSENKRLKTRIDELAQNQAKLEVVQDENKKLKQELKLNGTLTDYSTVNASVLSRSPSSWQNYLTINRGQTSGIKKNMPVMSGKGLIGRIVEVDKVSSKVELISTNNELNDKFAAEILGDNKNVTGVVSRYDSSTGDLVMENVNSTKDIKKGQSVITSGLGGLTPRGLYIGKVYGIKKDNYGMTNSVYITPAAEMRNFTVVTVIKSSVHGEN